MISCFHYFLGVAAIAIIIHVPNRGDVSDGLRLRHNQKQNSAPNATSLSVNP
ncbi:hypothetical protein H6G97_09510 [Nostoc flagelliforme FACHB-838]|uniref:Uncharacterized protein n=1 Tax=Nostoc flagelliforme FACHB-838 TaxID=2692904 RepID=A0ABR8DLM6_9NOSO|nr:hypothetical protein [Nostoc flagelliforme]MBD2529790.1 hypothetical protein [Nostoc flagelliforme FACHB-838]